MEPTGGYGGAVGRKRVELAIGETKVESEKANLRAALGFVGFDERRHGPSK